MNYRAFILLSGLSALTLTPKASATYPVFDAVANKTLNAILSSEMVQKTEALNQLKELKQQLETIKKIERVLGDPSRVKIRDVDAILKSAGLGDSGLFSSTGAMNIFGSMTADEFKQAVTDPSGYVSRNLMARALGVSAPALRKMGMKDAEISLAKSIVLSGGKSESNDSKLAVRFAELMTVRALEGMEKNAKRMEAMAAIVADDRKAAEDAAKTDLTQQFKVANEQANTANTLALEGLRQQSETGAATLSTAHAQLKILEAEERRRNLDKIYKEE